MFKKAPQVIFWLLIWTFFFGYTAVTAQNLKLELPVVSASAGDTLQVQVRSQGITGATSMGLGIRFSTNSLTFLSAQSQGTALANAPLVTNVIGNLLSISTLPPHPQALPSADSALIVLRFLAQGDASYLIWDASTEIGLSQQPQLIHGVVRPAGLALPALLTNGNQSACEFGTAQFNLAGTTGAASYQWLSLHPNASSPVVLGQSPAVQGAISASLVWSQLLLSDSGQVLFCRVTGPGYTSFSRPQALSVRSINLIPITLQIAPSGVVCSGQPVQVSVAGLPGGSMGSYQWYVNGQPAGNGSVLTRSDFRSGDEVLVEFTDTINCTTGQAQSLLSIAEAPANPMMTGGGVFCSDEVGVSIGTQISVTGTTVVLIRDGSLRVDSLPGTGQALSFGLIHQPGSYSLEVRTTHGCVRSFSDSISVQRLLSPVATVSRDTFVYLGNGIALQASGGVQYSWSPSLGLSNASVASPFASPTTTTVYSVVVTAANGCRDTAQVEVQVLTPPVVNAGNDTFVCLNTPAFFLVGTPQGGTWSGPGITQTSTGRFSPSAAGSGVHRVIYTVSSGLLYRVSDTLMIQVSTPPAISRPAIPNFCQNDPAYPLKGMALGAGASGFFTINGLRDSIFVPSQQGIGTHIVRYYYNNGTGCVAMDSTFVTVYALQAVSLNIPFNATCYNGGSFPLAAITGVGSPAGGVFRKGSDTISVFNPLLYPPGLTVISYSVRNAAGCVSTAYDTIQILDTTELVVANSPIYCPYSGPVPLNLVSPPGGIYRRVPVGAAGITGGSVFNPQSTGPGVFFYTYHFTNPLNGCTSVALGQIRVDTPPQLVFPPMAAVCYNSPPINLLASPMGGVFSGPGVVSNRFFPTQAGVGIHVLTYTYTATAGCTYSITTVVEVQATPSVVVAIVGNSSFCRGDSVILSAPIQAGVSHQWLRNGVMITGNTAQSLVVYESGTYQLRSVFATGCTDTSAPFTVTVYELPLLTVNALSPICFPQNVNLSNPDLYSGDLTGLQLSFWGDSLTTQALVSPIVTISGRYFVRVEGANGCRQLLWVDVWVLHPSANGLTATICAPAAYDFNGQSLSVTGTYTSTLTNAVGCDSVVTLQLTVNLPTTSSLSATICAPATYDFNGQALSASGT